MEAQVSDTLSVHQALAAVMAELPAIGKDDHASPQQGGYAYRGIEAITGHAQPLFAKHGVVTVPRVQSVDVRELTVNGKPWTDTTLVVEYTIVGPDGSTLTATCVGIGRDNADKGANKAMTQAFKYLLLQVLCISDAKDDADGTTVTADAPKPADEQLTEFKRLCAALDLTTAKDKAGFVAATLAREAKWSDLDELDKKQVVDALLSIANGDHTLARDNAGRPYAMPPSEPFDVPVQETLDA
jgi:hypothetical protein